MATLQTIRFGIEIETFGLTRKQACQAMQKVVGGTIEWVGGTYDTWTLQMADGRKWKAVTDASIAAAREVQAEVVSPILTYDDLDNLQEIVRQLRHAGAKVDESCGIHIHIDAAPFDAKHLINLVKIVYKQEELIEHAIAITDSRKYRWCRSIDNGFIRKLETAKPTTLQAINQLWYGYLNTAPQHYDGTRYRGLNLHNVWFRGTVEFRWFGSTLHAGKVKAYIQFCLAVAAKALNSTSASSKRRTFSAASAKYDFRCFLLGLGLIGDEFKTARKHLMEHLEGSAAWKHGRQPAAANHAAA